MKIFVVLTLSILLAACAPKSDLSTKSSPKEPPGPKTAASEDIEKTKELVEWIRTDNTKKAKALLADESSFQAGHPVSSPEMELTPLGMAVLKDNLEMVKLLLPTHHDLEGENEQGDRVLYRAAFSSSPEIVTLLLEANADPNARSQDGSTAMLMACSSREARALKVATALLSHDADPNIADDKGTAPIHNASYMAGPEMIRLLLKAGVNIDQAGPDGWTPLMLAASTNEFENLRVLLEEGADPGLQDDQGKTALAHAKEQKSNESEKLLR